MQTLDLFVVFANAALDVLLYSGQCAPGFGGAL